MFDRQTNSVREPCGGLAFCGNTVSQELQEGIGGAGVVRVRVTDAGGTSPGFITLFKSWFYSPLQCLRWTYQV